VPDRRGVSGARGRYHVRATSIAPRVHACAQQPPRTKGTAIARIDDLMETVDSRFHLVHLAAKRAREINDYYGQLGEGLGQHVPPLVVTESNKPLSIAMQEIAEGKIVVADPSEQSDDLDLVDDGEEE